MKKAFRLFFLLLMSGAVVFTSCDKDDEDDPEPVLKPVISLQDSTGYISADATLEVSSEFKVIVYVAENPESGTNIDKLRVIRTFNNNPNTQEIQVNDNAAFIEITFTAQGTAGVENIQFTAIDNDGQSNSVSIDITTEDVPGPISFYDDVVLGSFNDTEPSFFNTASGTRYNKANATANQDMIDFCFFKSTLGDNINYLAAPNDDKSIDVFDIGTWTTFNATKMDMTNITPAEFDAMTDDADIKDIDIPDPQTDYSRVELEVDKVYAFITVDGKIGLVKINDLYARGDRVNLDVKVQETTK
jgi:hypothetical protein